LQLVLVLHREHWSSLSPFLLQFVHDFTLTITLTVTVQPPSASLSGYCSLTSFKLHADVCVASVDEPHPEAIEDRETACLAAIGKVSLGKENTNLYFILVAKRSDSEKSWFLIEWKFSD
jgi:hypothetical protein